MLPISATTLLFIEKGGVRTIPDDSRLQSADPAGIELVATVMGEIERCQNRSVARALLATGSASRQGFPARLRLHDPRRGREDQERTRDDGKASSVQFLAPFRSLHRDHARLHSGAGERRRGWTIHYCHML